MLILNNSSRDIPTDRCSCREKGQPLCMEQYYRLFSSYRIPGVEVDKLVDSATNLALEPEHIIVISRNQVGFCSFVLRSMPSCFIDAFFKF